MEKGTPFQSLLWLLGRVVLARRVWGSFDPTNAFLLKVVGGRRRTLRAFALGALIEIVIISGFISFVALLAMAFGNNDPGIFLTIVLSGLFIISLVSIVAAPFYYGLIAYFLGRMTAGRFLPRERREELRMTPINDRTLLMSVCYPTVVGLNAVSAAVTSFSLTILFITVFYNMGGLRYAFYMANTFFPLAAFLVVRFLMIRLVIDNYMVAVMNRAVGVGFFPTLRSLGWTSIYAFIVLPSIFSVVEEPVAIPVGMTMVLIIIGVTYAGSAVCSRGIDHAAAKGLAPAE